MTTVIHDQTIRGRGGVEVHVETIEGTSELSGFVAWVNRNDHVGKALTGPDGPGIRALAIRLQKGRAPDSVVSKAGRVLSAANLKLVAAALEALTALYEAATDEGELILASQCIADYAKACDVAGADLVELAALGDVLAAHGARARIDDDEAFVLAIERAQKDRGESATAGGTFSGRPRPLVADLFGLR